MDIAEIQNTILNRYDGLQPLNTWGETSYFYNPDNKLARGTYFITIKEKDGDNDKASGLNRDGIYRINCGTTKADFSRLFGEKPARPSKGGVIEGPWQYDETNTLMPHPVYGWAGWLCVLNPDENAFKSFLEIADNYYQEAVNRFKKNTSK